MEWSAKFETDGSLLTISATGDVGDEGFRGKMEDVLACPAWHPGIPVLCDFRDLNIGKLTAQDIEHQVEIHRKYAGQTNVILSPVAVVVANSLAFGLARMWGIYANETYPNYDVFYRLADAMEWLRARAKEQADGLKKNGVSARD
jgi:hypothetical protein